MAGSRLPPHAARHPTPRRGGGRRPGPGSRLRRQTQRGASNGGSAPDRAATTSCYCGCCRRCKRRPSRRKRGAGGKGGGRLCSPRPLKKRWEGRGEAGSARTHGAVDYRGLPPCHNKRRHLYAAAGALHLGCSATVPSHCNWRGARCGKGGGGSTLPLSDTGAGATAAAASAARQAAPPSSDAPAVDRRCSHGGAVAAGAAVSSRRP